MSGFNGAMTLRSWRAPLPRSFGSHPSTLQWGHDLAVMERPDRNCPSRSSATGFNGAMTLRSWRARCTTGTTRAWCSFNGAMTLRSWRVCNFNVAVNRKLTLQWGHDLAVMESGSGTRTDRQRYTLQWGHDLAVMESTGQGPGCLGLALLQWGHDLAVMESV